MYQEKSRSARYGSWRRPFHSRWLLLLHSSKARTSDDAKRQNASTKNDMVRKAEFEKLVLKLSLTTEKTYSDAMVEQINSRIKGGLSYDDILEMFIVAGNPVD